MSQTGGASRPEAGGTRFAGARNSHGPKIRFVCVSCNSSFCSFTMDSEWTVAPFSKRMGVVRKPLPAHDCVFGEVSRWLAVGGLRLC